jgi:hypothetical protein
MNINSRITGPWSFVRCAFFQATWDFLTAGAIGLGVPLYLSIDEIFFAGHLPPSLDLKRRVQGLHWDWRKWLVAVLLVELAIVLKNCYLLWRQQYLIIKNLTAVLPESAPEVEVVLEGPPSGLLETVCIRNFSKESTVRDISPIVAKHPEGTLVWGAIPVSIVRAGTDVRFSPTFFVTQGSKILDRIQGIGAIAQYWEQRHRYSSLEMCFLCSDRRNYRYKITVGLIGVSAVGGAAISYIRTTLTAEGLSDT